MKYVLDTDSLIYFLKGQEALIKRFASVSSDIIHITIVNHAELLFGAYNSTQKKQNITKIQDFFQKIKILPFCEKSSHVFAEQKALLKKNGNMIADLDLMIVSITLQNNMTLVTNNLKHFQRINGLKIENWAE